MSVILGSPRSEVERLLGEIPKETVAQLRNECADIGGWTVVQERKNTSNETYRNKLSELAEWLENEEFEVERFQQRLNEKQRSWLKSHVKQIKEQLKGIEI